MSTPPPPPPRCTNTGAIGLYELQVRLLSRASTGDAGGGMSGSYGGGGLTAQYYSNARLAGRPLATRVRTEDGLRRRVVQKN